MRIFYSIVLFFFVFSCKEDNSNKTPKNPQKENILSKQDSISLLIEPKDNIYFVNAVNGLIIRDKPSIDGKKLGKLLYGSRIEVLKKTNVAFSLKEGKYTKNGYWTQIKHKAFTEAYVFSGYLQQGIGNLNALTFKVDNVEKATTKLKTFLAKDVYSKKINKTLFFTEKGEEKLVYTSNNTFIQSFQEAYDSHRSLTLSPDIIWLAIVQGFSIHMNENFKTLESQIFKPDKPKIISCFADHLKNDKSQWETLSNFLSKETSKYTNEDIYSLLVPDFSTTTNIERTAYHVNLLESFEQAFTYIGETGCGIPSITLEGKTEDWLWIYNNISKFEAYGLKDWVTSLKPVLKEFVETSKGNINTLFWKDAYKNVSEYMGFYISGWVIKFFPYIITEGEASGEYSEEHGGVKAGKLNHYGLQVHRFGLVT